jgi:hypothetical protein
MTAVSPCYVNNVAGCNMPIAADSCPSTGANRTHEAEIWLQTPKRAEPPGGGGRWQASLCTDEGIVTGSNG